MVAALAAGFCPGKSLSEYLQLASDNRKEAVKKLGDAVYASHDLVASGVVSTRQLVEAMKLADRAGQKMVLSGGSPTSGRLVGERPSEVSVVTGDVVSRDLSWLDALYRNELLELASGFAHVELFPSRALVSGININILRGTGASYEWHRDSNPVTGLLFLNTLLQRQGGALVFRAESGDLRVYPRAGTFLAFDARQIEHCVMPLKDDVARYSVPMNFYLDPVNQPRPNGLDEYLFGSIKPSQ